MAEPMDRTDEDRAAPHPPTEEEKARLGFVRYEHTDEGWVTTFHDPTVRMTPDPTLTDDGANRKDDEDEENWRLWLAAWDAYFDRQPADG